MAKSPYLTVLILCFTSLVQYYALIIVNADDVQADLQLTLQVSPSTVEVESTITYTIIVHNTGPADATAITITDILPDEMVFVASDSCTASGQVVSCSIATLANGADFIAVITVQAVEAADEPVVNGAVVSSTSVDPISTNNTASVIVVITATPVVQEADLQITQTSSSSSEILTVGSEFELLLSVYNVGPDTAQSVIVTDILPESMLFVSSDACVTGTDGSTLSCAVGELAAEATITLSIRVQAVQTASEAINLAEVSSTSTDPVLDNNVSTLAVAILATAPTTADLSLQATILQNRVSFTTGELLDYEFIVTNNGPAKATNVVIMDTLPEQLTFVSSASCVTDGVIVTCEIDKLAVNGTAVVIIRVQTTATGNPIIHEAQVTGAQDDLDFTNNTVSVSIAVSTPTSATAVVITTTPGPTQTPITIVQTVPVAVSTASQSTSANTSTDSSGVTTDTTAPGDVYGWRRFESIDWVQVTGTWDLRTANNASDGAYHETRSQSAILRYPFTGDGFRIGYRSSVHGGSFQIQADGEVVGVYTTDADNDLYLTETPRATYVTESYFLETGYHVVDVVAMVDGAGVENVNIDYIEIFQGPPMPETASDTQSLSPDSAGDANLTLVSSVELVSVPATRIPTPTPEADAVITVDVFVSYDTNANDQTEPTEAVSGITVRAIDVGLNAVLASGTTDATGFVRMQVLTSDDVVLLIPLLGESFTVQGGRGDQSTTWELRIRPANIPPLIP